MELDIQNLVSILAFDSRAIQVLLSLNGQDQNRNPVFYRLKQKIGNQIQFKSAIDIALENNQVTACNLIIDYIVTYQNNFCFTFLFQENFLDLVKKGISVHCLLNSDIFCH